MKKRILAFFMAVVMIFGLNTIAFASENLSTDDLTIRNELKSTIPTEVSLEWSKSSPGYIKINHVSADVDNVWYKLNLYRDDVLIKGNISVIWNKTSGSDVVAEECLEEYIVEDGNYYVDVVAQYRYFDADGDIDSSRTVIVTGKSDVLSYKNPGKLPVPGNISLSEDGIYTFDMVEGAAFYMVMFCADYAKADLEDSYMYGTKLTNEDSQDGKTISCDVSDFIKRIQVECERWGHDHEVDYTVKVMAYTDNILAARDSEWSEGILVYEYRFADEEASGKIETAFEKDDVTEVKTALTSVSSKTLADKIATNTEFAANFKTTDEKYKELVDYKAPVSTTDDVDETKVVIVGAAMNGENGEKVQLTFATPTEKVEVSDAYQNKVALDIKLMINDVSVKDLSIPVMITMPIPTGVNSENLVILHYHETGKQPQIITPVVHTDGTMTFVVTGFSTFVVANGKEKQEEPVTPPATGETTPPATGETIPPATGETIPPATGEATSPATADASVIVLWGGLLLAVTLVVVMRKKTTR